MKKTILHRNFRCFLILALVASLANLCHGQQTVISHKKGYHWVGAWASAQQLTEPNNMPPPPGLMDTTLRQIVRMSMGGKQVRVRFSNTFGPNSNTGLKINAAHIALSTGGSAINSATDKTLTFRGQPSVTIPPGAIVVSDPIDFDIAPLSDLAVTMYVTDTAQEITGHPGSRCTSYLQTSNSISAADMPAATKVTHWYYLSGIDVLVPDTTAAIAVLGDSITDGRGSTTDGNTRWPDNLVRRLQANPKTKNIAVLNQGIGGNALVRGGLGPTALARLDRDVLAQPGVHWLIVLEGINDLGGKASAEDIIAAYEQIALRAQDHNIRVYGATILPCGGSFYFSPELEAKRQIINQWIRTSGAFDAVIDMDVAMRDPNEPSRLIAIADGGDHLHPNNEGYTIMANTIDLKLFGKR